MLYTRFFLGPIDRTLCILRVGFDSWGLPGGKLGKRVPNGPCWLGFHDLAFGATKPLRSNFILVSGRMRHSDLCLAGVRDAPFLCACCSLGTLLGSLRSGVHPASQLLRRLGRGQRPHAHCLLTPQIHFHSQSVFLYISLWQVLLNLIERRIA